MVNRVILIGNLGRDPEVRRLENGAVVAKFSVATNKNYKDKSGDWQSQTEWHDVVAWRNLAERAESQLSKGSQVYVEGELTHRTWQDKDGNNRKTTEVLVGYFRVLNRRDNDGGGEQYSSADDEMTSRTASTTPASTSASSQSTETEGDDDLPF